MAKVKIQGNASGSAVYTVQTSAGSVDKTITLPDATGTLVNTAPSTSGNVLTSDGTNWTSAAAASSEAGNAAFSARFSSSVWTTIATNTILAFNNDSTGDSFDTDSVYNTTTYKFTAPATGVYLFYLSLYVSNWTDDDNHFVFAKNGADVNFQQEGSKDSIAFITTSAQSNIDMQHNATIVIPMSSTDTMEIQSSSASHFYGGLSYWGGCRLK